ncbi:MAG: hypothetical protein LC799_28150 [Actinobacteria bacterium]|nr:hypothetical protein [Actinomycetota bacterium]
MPIANDHLMQSTSEQMIQAEEMRPPWTVKVLVAWGIAGTAWGLAFGDGWNTSDLVSLGCAILFVWGMWTAKRWAFALSFAGTLLSGLFLVGYVVTGSTRIDTVGKIMWAIGVVGTIYLLRHPLTKRFNGIDKEPSSTAPSGPPDRGGRLAQATAVSLLGILAIGVPILWTIGKLEGVLLLGAVLACVGSGIAVLILGLPARSDESSPPSNAVLPN